MGVEDVNGLSAGLEEERVVGRESGAVDVVGVEGFPIVERLESVKIQLGVDESAVGVDRGVVVAEDDVIAAIGEVAACFAIGCADTSGGVDGTDFAFVGKVDGLAVGAHDEACPRGISLILRIADLPVESLRAADDGVLVEVGSRV